MTKPPPRVVRLFAYSSLLEGERDHQLLLGAQHTGTALTMPEYHLVDLGVYGALVKGGNVAVVGELYEVDVQTRSRIDVRKEHPVLFQRQTIRLANGAEAEAYLMTMDQVRGRRRLKAGDWRGRFAPSTRPSSPLSEWARSRRRP